LKAYLSSKKRRKGYNIICLYLLKTSENLFLRGASTQGSSSPSLQNSVQYLMQFSKIAFSVY
jgi:hypothetical protein